MERVDPLEGSQIKAMIDFALQKKRPDWGALVAVCAGYGLRIGDALRLRFSDLFDPAGGVRDSIKIREQKRKRDRLLKTPLWVCRVLEGYRDWWTEEHGYFDAQAKLFPWTRQHAWEIIRGLAEGCGITETKRVGPHSLRKFFCTEVYRRTRDPVLACVFTGHSSPSSLLAYIGFPPATVENIWADLAGVDIDQLGKA